MKHDLEKGIRILSTLYGRAITSAYVKKPLSWALYQAWKKVDSVEQPRNTETVLNLKEAICDKYCKYPYEWDAEAEGCELAESDICKNCPLNRL